MQADSYYYLMIDCDELHCSSTSQESDHWFSCGIKRNGNQRAPGWNNSSKTLKTKWHVWQNGQLWYKVYVICCIWARTRTVYDFLSVVLGKGPFRLITFRDRTTLLAASRSSGSVFLQRGNLTTTSTSVLSQFMMTPGLSRARPHGEFILFTHAKHGLKSFLMNHLKSSWFLDKKQNLN